MIVQMVSLVLDVIAGLVAGTCLLRLAMQAQRIPFNQPLGRFVFAMTDWIVMPLRKVIPPWSRWDLSSLAAAWLIKVLQFLLLWLLAGGRGQLGLLPLVSLVGLLQLTVSALSALVLVYALMSWVQPDSYFLQMADRLVKPWLDPVRRVVPLIGGVDLAPLVLLPLLVTVCTGMAYRLLRDWAGLGREQAHILMVLHEGEWLKPLVGPAGETLYVLLNGLGLLWMLGTGLTLVGQRLRRRFGGKGSTAP